MKKTQSTELNQVSFDSEKTIIALRDKVLLRSSSLNSTVCVYFASSFVCDRNWRPLAVKLKRWCCFLFLCSVAFPLPTIYQTRRRVVFNNMILHLNTLTLNPFPNDDDVAVYEPAKQSQLLTLRSSQKYFFPGQSYVQPVSEAETLSQQIRKVLL